jgi:hypothetical protein
MSGAPPPAFAFRRLIALKRFHSLENWTQDNRDDKDLLAGFRRSRRSAYFE